MRAPQKSITHSRFTVITFLSGFCFGMISMIVWKSLDATPNMYDPWDDSFRVHQYQQAQENHDCAVCTIRENSSKTDSIDISDNGDDSTPNEVLLDRVIPKFKVDKLYQDEYQRIDQQNSSDRCARYNLQPYDGPTRRIFFGTQVADEYWETFLLHAIEVYDVYHVAVFVESNSTHLAEPRTLRFQNSIESDAMLHSEMFGSKTQVFLDFWLEDWPNLKWMDRESEVLNKVTQRWKMAGMLPQDVGIVASAEEVFSRDFLRAIQTCDFPELRPEPSCHFPKIVPSTISFEMSPYCIRKKPWYHPDVIGGQCVDGIGDARERVVPLRNHKRMYGERHVSYGRNDAKNYPDAVHMLGRYPLFNAPDIRTVHGDRGFLHNFKHTPRHEETAAYGVAYRFHNWFADVRSLRNKLVINDSVDQDAPAQPLSLIHPELDIAVRCTKGIDNKANPHDWAKEYYLEGWKIEGPKPIAFLNKTLTRRRHEMVKQIVRDDEAIFGSTYDSTGRWMDRNTKVKEQRESEIGLHEKTGQGIATKEKFNQEANTIRTIETPNRESPLRNSSTTTVMGMATGLWDDALLFVRSLRKTGYQGHVIFGVSSDIDKSLLDQLLHYGVTPKFMTFANCTYEPLFASLEEEKRELKRLALSTCMEPYLDVKARWAKFPLGRDWLLECPTCTGPVMITDVRDVFFQRDPFGPGTPEVVGLQVYEEHPNVTTENWLVDWPVGDCKGVHLKEPMLCSGTTIGTRDAMITYLETMYAEMKRWIVDPKCRFKSEADDQSIHNWLFYNGDFKDAVAVKHREGVVNTIGYEGSVLLRAKEERLKRENITKDANSYPYPGATSRTWISTDFGLTNEDGEITNFDGSVSPVVHQFDRFGAALERWVSTRTFNDADV